MSNHITNRLVIVGTENQVRQVREFLKGEPFEDGAERFIDFNKIIPMPSGLNIDSGTLGELGEAFLYGTGDSMLLGKDEIERRILSFDYTLRQKCIELGQLYHTNLQKYKVRTWYDWSNKYWGTKWNAYNQKIESTNVIWFDTAWSCVLNLMIVLSTKFPDIEFDYCWADENASYNCGHSLIKQGNDETYCPDGGSKEAFDLYFELHPENIGYYELIDGNYQYKEEDNQ